MQDVLGQNRSIRRRLSRKISSLHTIVTIFLFLTGGRNGYAYSTNFYLIGSFPILETIHYINK